MQDNSPGSNEMDRLHWQCRRGMLELDEILNQFLCNSYNQLESKEKQLFSELLTESDPDLYQWLLVANHGPAHYASLVTNIVRSVKNRS